MLKQPFTIFFCLAFFPQLKSQETPRADQALWEEQLSGGTADNLDLLQWAEQYSLFEESKQALNFTSQEVLLSLPYLDIFKVNNILQHINHTGPILSKQELSTIKGIDSTIVEQLLRDFKLTARNSKAKIHWPNVLQYGRHQLMLRSKIGLEKRAGYLKPPEEGGFMGSRLDQLIRYRFRYRDNLQAAFNLQKDAGETWLKSGKNLGFDYFSGHIALRNYGFIEELILGDFNAEFGQGMALWSSMSLGRSFSAVDIKRYGRGLTPYAGSDENRFYRGIATSLKWQKLRLDLFLSHKKIDGKVTSNLAGDSLFSENLGGNGLYRTLGERSKKDRNTLSSLGSRLEFKGSKLDLGINYRTESLKVAVAKSSKLYQAKEFSGQRLHNLSLDWNYIYRRLNVFGELALDAQQDPAISWGLQSILTDNFRLSYHYRSIGLNYQAIWNAPFAEKGNAGENGHYLGFDWQINRKLNYNGFYDQHQFRWISYREIGPSRGFALRNNLNYQLTKRQNINMRFGYQQKESVLSQGEKLSHHKTSQVHLRLQLENNSWRKLESKTTLQVKSIHNGLPNRSKGFMIAQDFRHRLRKDGLKISYRFALISSPNYDSRLYSYERDLYLSFSIPAYYGESTRFFILADWQIGPNLKLQAKYALSYFYKTLKLSSGLNEIAGPFRSDLGMQLILKL